MLNKAEILSIVFKIIVYSGIVQGIYSSIVLTHTKLRNPANHYLAILLLILSFCILHSTFIVPYFSHYHKVSFQIKEPFILLVVPFIWLYVKKLNEPTFRFRKKHLLHYVPFIIVMLFSFLYLARHREFTAEIRFHSHAAMLGVVIYILALGQFIFYLYYIFKLIRSFKFKALNELSNTENIDPAWLKLFLVIFLTVFVLLIMMMIIAIHKLDVSYFNNVVSVVFAFTIYILGYKGLFQQTILPINNNINVQENIIEEKAALENKVVDKQLLSKLFDFMIKQKPYHDPELTLTSLASQIEISRNLLSELINSGTGGNFYDFVNKYRIEEVKVLMSNPKYKDFTILAIAFEAGFPSKSTFNSIFKKFTSLTPSEYRNGLS
jgi:AraC-like DNA-binding protein